LNAVFVTVVVDMRKLTSQLVGRGSIHKSGGSEVLLEETTAFGQPTLVDGLAIRALQFLSAKGLKPWS
jgi:hypothetical protein